MTLLSSAMMVVSNFQPEPFFVHVAFIQDHTRIVHANVTFEKGTLEAIDAAA